MRMFRRTQLSPELQEARLHTKTAKITLNGHHTCSAALMFGSLGSAEQKSAENL